MLKREIVDGVVELIQDSSAAMRGNVNRWVNYVLDDLASRGHLHSLQREERCTLRNSTVAPNTNFDMNTGRNYDLAPDTDKIFKVFVPAWGCDGILKRVSHDDFLRRMLSDGAVKQGQPCIYTVFGLRTLRIHPIPTTQYAPAVPTDLDKLYVWKYKDPAHLREEDEITEWKIKHTPLIIAGAYSYGARFDNLGDYPPTKMDYEAMVVRLFKDENEDLDVPSQVAYNDS